MSLKLSTEEADYLVCNLRLAAGVLEEILYDDLLDCIYRAEAIIKELAEEND